MHNKNATSRRDPLQSVLVDVGVCISETKHNRVACERDAGIRAAGWERERRHKGRRKQTAIGSFDRTHHFGDPRIQDVQGLAAGAHVVKSGEVVSGNSTSTQSHKLVHQSTHSEKTNEHDSSRPTLRSRPAPMQFTSPHPAPDWLVAARASDDLALQRAPPAPLAPRPAPGPSAPRAPRPAPCPTSGESRMSTRNVTNHFSTFVSWPKPKLCGTQNVRPVWRNETRNLIKIAPWSGFSLQEGVWNIYNKILI